MMGSKWSAQQTSGAFHYGGLLQIAEYGTEANPAGRNKGFDIRGRMCLDAFGLWLESLLTWWLLCGRVPREYLQVLLGLDPAPEREPHRLCIASGGKTIR